MSAFAAWRFHRPLRLSPGVEVSRRSGFTVVRVDLRRSHLDLFWKSTDGQPLLTFDRLSTQLQSQHNRLIFAANAGIFSPGYVPLGLHVENGRELVPLNLASGPGNFYMQPNGVFFIDATGAHITESRRYPGTTPDTRLATQSGPLLVLDGRLNPSFRKDSDNLQIRSAVGVLSPDEIVLVLSDQPVTFFSLAKFCRDKLSCRDALYLDGAISRFYPAEKPTGGVESNFAGFLAITENPPRLPARHSPGKDSRPGEN